MKKIIRKPLFYIPVSLTALIIVILSAYFSSRGGKELEFALAKNQDIVQEISVTGRVKASHNLDLAFEKTGKISAVYSQVGDKVYPGKVIVALENSELSAQLLQAEANFEAEQAKLDELEKGTRPEEISLQEIEVEKAKASLEDAKENVIDKLEDSYTKSDNAVRNNADQLFNNSRYSNAELNFVVADYQMKVDIEGQRVALEGVLFNWNLSLDSLTAAADLSLQILNAKDNLKKVKSLLDKISLVLNDLDPQGSITQANIDSWKSDISSARTDINTAISNITSASEKLRTAESVLASEQEELQLKKIGTVPEQILAQEAKAKSALANIQNIKAQLSKTYIVSPISGIVSKQEAKKGEIVGANSSLVSVISDSKFEIEANIAEVDIAKIKIGDSAKVTLDAYGDYAVFEAEVIKIDPAETIIDGVATYKTTLQFKQEEERIKAGMTANVSIQGQTKINVLAVPYRSVIKRGDKQFVKILVGKEAKETEVKTGLKGSDGNIEITEGLQQGDKVLK